MRKWDVATGLNCVGHWHDSSKCLNTNFWQQLHELKCSSRSSGEIGKFFKHHSQKVIPLSCHMQQLNNWHLIPFSRGLKHACGPPDVLALPASSSKVLKLEFCVLKAGFTIFCGLGELLFCQNVALVLIWVWDPCLLALLSVSNRYVLLYANGWWYLKLN